MRRSPPDARRTAAAPSAVAEAALVGAVALSVVALGGAAGWALPAFATLAALAAVAAALAARARGGRLRVPLLALPLALAAGLWLLQLVPLPPGLLAALSPAAAEVHAFALAPLGLGGARPLSLDPPATWRHVALGAAALLLLVAAAEVARAPAARRRLLGVLPGLGAGLVALGLLHRLVGEDARLLGLYTFRHVVPPLVTPFVNPNHLAGFLALAGAVGLGLALAEGPRRTRAAAWAGATVLCGLGVLLSLSRAGIAFWALGQVLVAGLALRAGPAPRPSALSPRSAPPPGRSGWAARLSRSGAALAVLAGALGVGGYLAYDQVAAELATAGSLERLERSKVDDWPMYARAAAAYPVLGMGRGAFEAAFPRHQDVPKPNTLTHPENAVLQLAAEGGAAGLLVLVLLAAAYLRLWGRAGLGPAEHGALAGVLVLALHNLFDFSLELPACAGAALLALGCVARGPSSREAPATGAAHRLALQPLPALGGVLALALLALGALVPARHTLARDEALLRAAAEAVPRVPLERVRALGREVVDRHPAAHGPPLLLGLAHAHAGRPAEALAFVNRALFLRPLDPSAHVVAARALRALGAGAQAFLEYRLAAEAGAPGALREGLRAAHGVEELAALTPRNVDGALELARALGGAGVPRDVALGYVAWAQAEFDGAPRAAFLWEHEAHLRLGAGDLEGAGRALEGARARAPDALEPQLLHARLLQARGDAQGALAHLASLRSRFPGSLRLAHVLAQHQTAAGRLREARETLHAAMPFATGTAERAQLLQQQAQVLLREGALARALDVQQTAARLAPSPEAHFSVARTYEQLRRPDAAARAVREGLGLFSPDADPKQRADAEAWAVRLEGEAARARDAARETPQRRQGEAPAELRELELLRGR